MSALAISAGLFASGIAVGVTGALLLRKPEHNVIISQQSIPVHASIQQTKQDDNRLIHGNPGPVADFLRHVSYVSAYDRMHKHPHWTAEHITAAHLRPPLSDNPENGKGDRSKSVFKEDERIPILFRSKNSDYFRSGYDRGHMVPAADSKISQIAMDETFLLSNIAPQIGEGFNRDYWAHLEDYVRRLTNKFENLYVFTIPLYLPRLQEDGKWRVNYEVIGNPPAISVPTHFAKVIYAQGKPGDRSISNSPASPLSSDTRNNSLLGKVGLSGSSSTNWTALGAFVLPNAIIPNQQPLKSFLVPVEAVERASGLMLFPPATKTNTPSLCDVTDCEIIVRDFSDRNKQTLPKIPIR